MKYMKRVLFIAFSLTILLMFGAGCNSTPRDFAESIPPVSPSDEVEHTENIPPVSPSDEVEHTESIPPELPSDEVENTMGIPAVPEQSSAISYRLVFPAERVFSCAESYSSVETPIQLNKDEVENGWVYYDKSLIPFSDYLLEHPDASLLMWTGVHQAMLESWEISLNDGWICYMYQGEMDHATGTGDPGGRGTEYSAMIGQPGDEYVFCLFWNNYFETSFDEPLESFQENDPGYVSLEDMKSFLSGIVVEGNDECP